MDLPTLLGLYVMVHDVLQQREGVTGSTSVSSYRKLRLVSEEVRRTFQATGLKARMEPGP